MRKSLSVLLSLAAFVTLQFSNSAEAAAPPAPEKEWTMLVFLNGHNNLDSFGAEDINEMERVGSSSDINIVVQWASLQSDTTKRVFVTRDNNTNDVSSVTVQDLPRVDMGDYRNLVEFIRWGAANFPAKHYFVDVWNHGSGWRMLLNGNRGNRVMSGGVSASDISFDDITSNVITTEQLGKAMDEASAIIGRKIDIYGSDACLMGMAEVGNEMVNSVKVMVGSQELEPGDGWPYDELLIEWSKKPKASAREVAKMLTEAYLKSYANNGTTTGLTLSAVDLEKMQDLNRAVSGLTDSIKKTNASEKKKILEIANRAQAFYYNDYIDLGDFVSLLAKENLLQIDSRVTGQIQDSMKEYVISSKNSSDYAKASGTSFWFPTSREVLDSYLDRYKGLKFHAETGWAEALQHLHN